MISTLTTALYGKDKTRVFRVVMDGKWHRVVEYNVTVLVEGDISTRCPSLVHRCGLDAQITNIQLHGSRQLCGRCD
jgi:hypothetical protein